MPELLLMMITGIGISKCGNQWLPQDFTNHPPLSATATALYIYEDHATLQ